MRKSITITATVALLAAWCGVAWADDDAEKEVTKQTTRQVSGAVVGRVGTVEAGPENQMYSVWSTTSYNSLTVKTSGANIGGATPGTTVSVPNFQVNLYQEIVGIDARFDRFIAGVSTAIAYTNGSQGASTSGFAFNSPFGSSSGTSTGGSTSITGASWTLSPYVAYVLNQNIFFVGVVGYTYGQDWTRIGAGSSTSTSATPAITVGTVTIPASSMTTATTTPVSKSRMNQSTLFTDLSVNGIFPVPNTALTLSGRVGTRYYYSWTDASTSGGGSGSFSNGATTVYTAVEARYTVNKLQPYARAQYEYAMPTGGGGGRDSNDVLLAAGLDVLVNPSLTVGADFMWQLGDPNVTNWQIALNVRAKF